MSPESAKFERLRAWGALALILLVGPTCGGGGGGGGGNPAGGGGGGPVFSVVRTSPAHGDTAARTATIYVTVNGMTDPATLATGSVTLTGAGSITVGLVWNAVTGAIEITPSGPMDSGATMTVTLTAQIATLGGTHLVPYAFTFNTIATADTTPPTFGGLSSISPAGVGTTSIAVSWSAGTDTITAQANLTYDVYLAAAAGGENFGNPPFASVTGMIGTTLSGLNSNTAYFFIVRCRDQAENEDGNTTEQSATTLVSFVNNIYIPIVHVICVQCHIPGGMAAFMDLDQAGAPTVQQSASIVVNQIWVNQSTAVGEPCMSYGHFRVIPNDIVNSLVYLKITQSPPPCGVQMPEGGPYLSSGQTDLFKNWILQGANDN